MTRPIKIAPSILTADFGHLADAIGKAESGGADYLHLDVMDGLFVPNISFGLPIVAMAREVTALPIDVHLMMQEPERYLPQFAEAGSTTIHVHAEATLHLHRAVQQILDLGCRAGVAINPATSIEAVREVLPLIDVVLVMTVNPGFGSQKFIETSTSKLRRLRVLRDELNPICDLQVDGGINTTTVGDAVRSGANVIVAGSAVYNEQGSVAKNIGELREAARQSIYAGRVA